MSLANDTIKTSYPLPAYNYKVTVDADTIAFSEVSGLSISYEKVTYKHGFSFLTGATLIRAQQGEINVTLKRGIVAKRSQLYNWFAGKLVKDIFIDLCDESGTPLVRWKVSKALPLKLDAPSFAADDSSRVAIESLDVTAQNISVEYF